MWLTLAQHYRPSMYSWEIRDRLLTDGVCSHLNVPSVSQTLSTRNDASTVNSEQFFRETKLGANGRNTIA